VSKASKEQACIYNESDDEDKEVHDNLIFFDEPEDDPTKMSSIVPSDQRMTKPFMTKYEEVRLLGDRTQQLSLGAKPMIKNVEGFAAIEIAKLELEQNCMPLYIERRLPNGKRERWYSWELKHRVTG